MYNDVNIILSIIVGTLIAATPLYLAALGELVSERSGVINIGLEGIILMGAVVSVVVDIETGNLFLAIFSAIATGIFFGLFHGILSVYLGVNQVAAGLSLFIFCEGLSGYVGSDYVGKSISGIDNYSIPILSRIPILGEIIFNQNPFVYLMFLLVPLSWMVLYRTKWGIAVRACGENPSKAYNIGVKVSKVRLYSSILSGLFAGLGGASLSLAITQSWTANMVAGRGWIAIGMIIFARWKPFYVFIGSLLFGAMSSVNFTLQSYGANVSFYFLSMLPYIITIMVLIYTNLWYKRKNIDIPYSLGKPLNL